MSYFYLFTIALCFQYEYLASPVSKAPIRVLIIAVVTTIMIAVLVVAIVITTEIAIATAIVIGIDQISTSSLDS